MVPMEDAMQGDTFHLSEDEQEPERYVPPSPARTHVRFPVDARDGKVHTCVLFVVAEVHRDTTSVPLRVDAVRGIQNTFGAMIIQPDPVHVAAEGLHVFLGTCTGQQVMDAWMSDLGRRTFAGHLGQHYRLDYVVSVPHAVNTQLAWDTYKQRISSSSSSSSSSPGKYVF